MLAELGYLFTLFAFIASVYAIFAGVWGAQRRSTRFVISARNSTILAFLFLTGATVALQTAIMTQNYQVAYVWSVSSPDMPTFFRWTALWGSQAGSLLFWCFLMALFAAAAVMISWKGQRRLMPYFIAYSMAVLAFFIGITLFIENPFSRYWITATGDVAEATFQPAASMAPSNARLAESARGLNPLLRHFGMAIHPPLLYLGFVGLMIPFAFAMAALASGDLSVNWIKGARRWTLVAWLFLSLGLILGGRWAYDVLGWGGYWGWDPVENAAFLPWLVGTAFLHSVMIEEKRGMLRVWNMVLIIMTFSAVIFGTFATRSGLVDSVHSFARSGIGFPMFTFWFLLTLISAILIIYRKNRGELQDRHQFANLMSRETLFVLNNFVFVALFIAVFWGSFGAPIISELFMDTDITLGVDYFMRVTPPLFGALFLLMGIAPLSAWGATSLPRLGRALVVPLILTALSVVGFALTGMNSFWALLSYGLVSLAGWVAVYEYGRAVAARVKRGDNPLAAMGAILKRNPRRYGGYMVHIGVVVIGLGTIGSTLYQIETQRTLSVGESLTIGDYEMRYDNFLGSQVAQDGRIMDIAEVTVIRDGREIAELRPRRDFFPTASDMNTMTIAGARSTLENDFYVLLVGWEPVSHETATFKVYVNPLVNLVWWGGIFLIIGTAISAYPNVALPARMREELRMKGRAGAKA